MPSDDHRPPDADLPPFGVRRGARTTHRRGRMTDAKRSSIHDLGPTWMLEPDDIGDGQNLTELFDGNVRSSYESGPAGDTGSSAETGASGDAVSTSDIGSPAGAGSPGQTSVVDSTFSGVRLLDIGVGNGTASVDWALQHPDDLVVAVELHQPGIVALLQTLDADGPANVRVVEADVEALLDQLAAGAVTDVRILFPDPWPKKRHTKRRLIDEGLIATIADLLPVGGTLHLATDWVDYADQMRRALATEPRLDPRVDLDGEPAVDPSGEPVAAPRRWRTNRPDRPVTVYEQRGLDAGRSITDLVATRT